MALGWQALEAQKADKPLEQGGALEQVAARIKRVMGLTFELSGRRRQATRPGLAKMYRVPPDRAWWPAVGAPLERGVRPHCERLGPLGAMVPLTQPSRLRELSTAEVQVVQLPWLPPRLHLLPSIHAQAHF